MGKKRYRLRTKKYRSKKFKVRNRILTTTFIFVLISVLLLFGYMNSRASDTLLTYAEVQTRKLTTIVINRAISKQVAEGMDVEELFIIEKDNNGKIQSVHFNTYIVNKVLSKTTNNVQMNLKALEEGKLELLELPDNLNIEYDEEMLKKGIIFEIPIGIITKNAFLANLGPKIPVRFHLIGDVVSNVGTNTKEYGINNALIEIYVHIEVQIQVLLPLLSKKVKVETDIPIALKLINGEVPRYYQNGIESSSTPFVIPVE